MQLEQIRCTEIRPDPRSRGWGASEVEALAESIRSHGVLRPILLRASGDGYQIVHGERRWRAARLAGLEAIPACLVQDVVQQRPRAA